MRVESGGKYDNGLFNGSSLSNLTGAVTKATTHTEVRFPASSMAEVLETIHDRGHTGNLTINFSNGRAMDMKWASSRNTKPDDV